MKISMPSPHCGHGVSLMVTAALGRDAALSSVIVMLSALMVSLTSLVAETAADLIDPRRRRKA